MVEVKSGSQCPNCGTEVVVPKSTRSFICRSCDALIKAVGTESGFVLKLVGKSVEEDPEYKLLEESVSAIKSEVAEIHAKYLTAAGKPLSKVPGQIAAFGALVGLVGLVLLAVMPATYALATIGAGVVLLVLGLMVGSSQRGAKQAEVGVLGAELERLARERDHIAARAARMRVTI